MTTSTQSTLVLLLFSFVALNGIRYWRRVPYGSNVGSFTWITHRGILLYYMPGFAALTTQHSCQVPSEGSPRHALCQIPFLGREWTFALFTAAAVFLWISTMSEVLLYWRSDVKARCSEGKHEDHMFGTGTSAETVRAL